jgi:molybdate transport system ATP-binding protein
MAELTRAAGGAGSGLRARFERRFAGGPTIAPEFEAPAGAVSVLFGPSGAGKTTVLRCLAGLERPDAGSIRLSESAWFDAAARVCLPPQQRGVGLLAQDYALFPHLSAEQNVGYGLASWPRDAARARVDELLRLLRIDGLRARRPGALSGGEQQRVALARALAPRPRLLLLDEPLSALDAPTRDELRGELRRVLRALEVPALLVTHERLEALALGDRMIVLAEGRVRQCGTVPEVFSRPSDRDVARLVGVESVLPARVEARSDGLARVEASGLRLTALDPGGDEIQVFACVRAEDVLLQHGSAPASSARNRLAARVTSLVPEGPLVRLGLDCGGPALVALVTRHAAEELALAPGAAVVAVVKTTSIHLVPR